MPSLLVHRSFQNEREIPDYRMGKQCPESVFPDFPLSNMGMFVFM
jgi:hypothetical protein